MTQDIKININLFPWQSDCLDQITQYPHSTHVIKAKRQVGKSILCELIILKWALEHNNTDSHYVLPSFRQCQKVWQELTAKIENCFFVQKIDNALLIIKFINGSTIQMFSGEQKLSSLQGFTTSGVLIIDEAAFLDGEVINNILPWTNVHSPLTIFVSTPQFQVGPFWDFWCQGLDPDNEDVLCFDFCEYDTSILLTKKKLEYYKRTLPEITFRQHYLGQFAENQGSVFGDFSKTLYKKGTINCGECVFGIDFCANVGQDETAITIATTNNEVIDIIHFSDKEATETIDIIVDLAKKFSPKKITCEKNSIGNIYIELIKKGIVKSGLRIPVYEFNTTNESKQDIISNLQVLIQNNEVKLPDDDALKVQLMKYEMTVSKTGKPVYNAAIGYHDDMIMSAAIALWSVKKNKPKVSF